MTIITSGHGIGLQDGALGLLNRNDLTGAGTLGQGPESLLNVANGNLLIQERDVFLPSQGMDFALVRTYNSRGAIQGSPDGWWWSTSATLSKHQDTVVGTNGAVTNYVMTYGDGTSLHFDFNSSRNLWLSTDGAGAYETLREIGGNSVVKYIVTRADRSEYRFDKDFVLLAIVDSNGVSTDFTYQGGLIQTVRDDTGHEIVYQYSAGKLTSVVDRHAGQADVTLVRYAYTASQLTQVTDRFGHVTHYTYNSNGLLVKVSLPSQQTVNGQLQVFDAREIQFTYQQVDWNDNPHLSTAFDSGSQWIVTSVTDPMGGVTTLDYNFQFNTLAPAAGDRDLNYKQVGGRYFAGGTTRVVDAMGNGLATSNAAEFQAKRVSLGYAADVGSLTQAQKDALRELFSISYTVDPDGYITRVVDQQGLATVYTYGGKTAGEAQTATNQDNLLSVTDRNGAGATTSDSAYFRALRRDLGFVDVAGNGKLVSALTAAEVSQLLASFTTRFTYDANGNLASSTDAQGNQASYTYTAANKVATATSAMGNALATSDAAIYQAKRAELGYPAALASLSTPQKAALRALYTTTYTYDSRQNLTSRSDPGGDVTEFTYDAAGNLTRRTVLYRDASGAAVAAKNQVTAYAYDAFGNNTSTVDAEGAATLKTFDHFGNLLTVVDGRGGITAYTYDADNRLLTHTDAEGHTTVNRYDAVGNRIAITDAAGKTVTQLFDNNNLLIATIDPSLADPAATRSTAFTYDILGNRTEVTDAEGRKTVYSYDARRQLVDVRTPQVLRADGTLAAYTTTYAYDGESRIVTTTDDNGGQTQSLYTTHGLVKRVTDAVGNVTEFLYDANLQQVQVTIGAQLVVALRRVLKFGYDEENQATSQTDAMGFVTRSALDATGNVVAVTDANGNTTRYDYDRNNRLVKETRPLLAGQATAYTVLHRFDANGNEVETTDENGNTTTFAFDKDNNQVMVSDANGIETVFTYDSRHNQTRIAIGVQATLDANGRPVVSDASQAQVTRFAYDEFNQIVSSTDGVGNALVDSDASVYQQLRTELGFAAAVGGLSLADKTALLNRFTERYAYDRVGNLVRSVDHLGRITTLEYDALNRLQQRTEAQGLPDQRVTSLRYDGNGNVVKSTDGLGRNTQSAYDAVNRLTTVTDPLGVATRIDYDNVGNIVASTEAFGTGAARRTEYVYDLNDRLVLETDPGAHEVAYQYDAVGNRLRVTDARGGATQYVYDAMNRNVQIIDPLSFQTRYEYDGVGNRITLVDARGGISRFSYDPGNRMVQATDAEGRITRLAYDPLGNAITQTTAFGTALAEVTLFSYDAEGNLRSATDAAGQTSSAGYDDAYNTVRTTDANGHTTRYGFDALNRQLRITDPLGGLTTYTYDAADNRLTETDALGRSRSFAYDANDRLITETNALLVQTQYSYDPVGNQVSITRAANTAQAATTQFIYDTDDQLVQQIDALNQATGYLYDANHNVVRTVDANGNATHYSYDAADRLVAITDALGNTTQFTYDGNGNRVRLVDARGNATTRYFNLDNELVLTVDAKGFATTRSHDANGNLVAETQHMVALALPVDPAVPPLLPTSPLDRTTTYAYDALNRVVQRTDPLLGEQRITYDAVGNRLSDTDENQHTTHYAYDANDRRISTTDALGGVTLASFDAVGNRLSETDANGHTAHNAYDALNRLSSATNARGDTTHFSYDAVGNLLTQTDALGRTASSAYDLVDRLVLATDERGIRTALAHDAVGNVLSQTVALGTASEATTRFAYDATNRLVGETDALNQTTLYAYDAVGNRTQETEPDLQVTVTAFDALNRIETVTDALGRPVVLGYDGAGNQVLETDANGRSRIDYHDANNRLVLTVDAEGYAESNTYDPAGNLLSNTRHMQKLVLPVDPNVLPVPAASPGDKTTRYTYDALDRIATLTDGEGYVTAFGYDKVGNQTELRQQVDKADANKDEVRHQYFDELDRLIATLTGEGHLSTVQYDALGNPTGRTDHDKTYAPPADGTPPPPAVDDPGRQVQAEYDENGRLVKETDHNGVVTTHGYDDRGNQTSTVHASGTAQEHGKQTKYDKADRVVESVDALGIVTRYTYDRNGNVVTLTEAAGRPDERSTHYQYNRLNQVTQQTDALGQVNEYRYDAFGNKTGQTLAKGRADERTESFQYDGNNQLTRQVNGEGEVTRFEYDGAGNQTRTIVAEGLPEQRIRSFEYDRDHRVVAEVDGNGVRTEYRYDGQGNRTDIFQAVNRPGETRHSSYVYDKDGNLTAVTDAMGSVTRFTVDATGNQTEIVDANGAVTRNTYDALGRLVTTVSGVGGAGGGVKTVNQYDACNNIVATTQSFADGSGARTTRYAYDLLDRQTLVTDAEGFSTRFGYDAFGNQTQLETGLYLLTTTDTGYDAAKAARAHTVSLAFTYDRLDRLLTTTNGVGGVVESTYDAFGNRLSQATRTTGNAELRTVTLTYDRADRLLVRATPAGGLDTFRYDKAGNQVERKTLQDDSGAAPVYQVTSYAYDGNGKVVTETDALGTNTVHVLDAVGNEIETRFATGHPEERSLRSVFNLANVLVAEVDAEGRRSDYAVDAVGNRIQETDALGRVTHLYYDALGQHVGTLDAERYYTAFEHDAMGNITASHLYLNRYAAPADMLAAPAPAAADPKRTVTTVFDGAGNPVSQLGTDGARQTFVYSSTRKLISQTTHGNDDAAAILRTSDSTARVLRFEYDSADRMVKFTNADGVIETYTYDAANNKTRETVSNPNLLAGGRSDPQRSTQFQYDLDNRLVRQVFDPAGVNLVEQIGYDDVGNVVQRADANGNASTIGYDAMNRQTRVTDALGGAIQYSYDRVGNRTAVTDARGYTTNLKYDRNGQVVEELKPQVDTYTLAGGAASLRPKTTTVYDAAGNTVQIVDAAGHKTTRWYDGNDNLVAELNGDNALREYAYNATDDLVSITQYMTRLDPTAHDPLLRPSAPAGEARTVTNEYDSGGRLVRVVYPAVEVTTLGSTGTASPTSSATTRVVDERNHYDRFGNLVESFDRNGNRSVSYYDVRGRVVALVDAAGYLIESDFDSQDHVVQQRKYAGAVDMATLSAGVRPVPVGSAAAVVDRVYDVANRLFEETSAAVQLQAGAERIVTRFGYDKVGNQTSRTVAFGTADAAAEYSYYDAANRMVGVVGDNRMLVQFDFDANGNNTQVKRYFGAVANSVALASASFAQVKAGVTADTTNDQNKTNAFDALNRQSNQTDLMGLGTADDIQALTQYDAVGNVTLRTDPLGNVSKTAHDALGHVVQSVTPDGNSSFIEYDTGGLRVRSWTGDLGSIQAVQATGIAASIGDDLRISWNLTGNNLRSYVVYDTVQHNLPGAYARKTGEQGSGNGVAVGITLDAALPPGTTVYFRVVTVDSAGSTAWTEERSLVVPARLTALAVSQSGANLVVTVRFSGTVGTPQLVYGTRGSTLGDSTNFVLQGDGSYRATITGPSDPQALAYQVRWTFSGNTYTTSAQSFEAPGAHVAIGQTLTWPVPLGANGTAAANGQFVIVNGVRVDNAQQVNGQLQFEPGLTGSGTSTYHVYYGDLASTSHSVSVAMSDRQSTFVRSDTNQFNSADPPVQVSRTLVLGWQRDGRDTRVTANLSGTEAATVGAGGVHVAFKAASDTDVFSGGDIVMSRSVNTFTGTLALATGSYDLLVYYVDTSGKQVIVEWKRVTVPAQAALPADTTVVDGAAPFDFAGQTTSFSRSVGLASATYDGTSVIVAATERHGSITRAGNGRMTVDPGLYSGGLDPTATNFTLPSVATASAGPNAAKSDGLSAGTYFIETVYNAVGAKIATNEDTGLWRRLGVDANGNAVQTRTYGTRADETAGRTPVTTFTAFDARNLEVAKFGAAVLTDANGNGINDGTRRAVTRSSYDYAARLASRTSADPGALARTYTYDGVGNLTRETNALGHATSIVYDRRGHETRRTDALGHTQQRNYDAFGRMTSEVDGAGTTTSYAYDNFDRTVSVTDGLAHTTQLAYDQHDRLVRMTDAGAHVTRFSYDKRDDRTWTVDANGHYFGTAYDAMRRVTHNYSFQGGNPTSLADAIDATTNAANAHRAFLVDEANGYDIFGNKVSQTDAMGRARYFSHGAFGRLQSQTDEGGRVTAFTYDRFGNPTAETSASTGKNIVRAYDDARRLLSVTDSVTKVTTTYTYDAGGNRRHETVSAPDFAETVGVARNISYSYDGAGQMTVWSDAASGIAKNLTYAYDAAGNLTRVSGSDSTDHVYAYDAADRLLSVKQGGTTVLSAYTYDAAGNRATYNNGTTTVTYTYDTTNHVSRATQADSTYATWTYDAVGNITAYTENKADGAAVFTQSSVYSENNLTLSSATQDARDAEADNHSDSKTDNALDLSGRLLTETLTDLKNESKTTVYTHAYATDGRELTVTVTGGSSGTSGSSSSTYDANDRLIRLDLGQSDSQEAAEYKRFIYSSDGQILRRFHDDGEDDTTNTTTTQYLYALGNPVGETGNTTDGTVVTVLDREGYDLVNNISDEFPGTTSTRYTVRLGDSLQSIAGQIYGNPSLWFVIADANGLTGDVKLTEGTTLQVPNTVQLGRLTAETHAVYNESEIVGSRLPNLKAPPPDDSAKCAAIGAIILVILVAILGVILSIVTVGIAAPAAAAAVGATAGAAAGIIAGVLVGAAIGAVVAFGVSALSQAILVGFGLQKEFDWTQVLADTAVGFISGGVAGLGELIQAGILIGRVAKIATVVASVVLEAAGETLRQVIVNPDHRPDNPLSIVLAGVGGGFGAAASVATRAANLQSARKVVGAVERSGILDKSLTIGSKFRNTIRKLQDGTKIVRIVQKDGTVVFKQVTRLSAAAKGAPVMTKVLDVVAAGVEAAPTRTIAKITADIQAVKALSTGQRAANVLADVVGHGTVRALGKFGKAVSDAVSPLGAKVSSFAKTAAMAVGEVGGKAADAVADAAGTVGKAVIGAAKAVIGGLKTGVKAAVSAVGELGGYIGRGLAKLGGVLAKPFKAAAQGLVRTALGQNAAGKYRAARYLAIATLAPVAAIGKIGSLAVRGVGKLVDGIAEVGSRFGEVASDAFTKLGKKVVTGFEKASEVVSKVANGAAQKAGSAVKAIGKRLEPVTRELENVGIILAKLGRAVGRKVKDIVLAKLDPLTLPLTVIGGGLSGGRVLTRGEGDPGKQRARYFRTQNGLAGPTTVAYGTQGPAGGIGKAIFGVLSGELPFRPTFRPPVWENNAARTTTGVYSGFQIDRAVDLRSVNALNQIRLGRVAALDQATRDAYASQAIGRVSTYAEDVPIALLNPFAPDPSPVLGA